MDNTGAKLRRVFMCAVFCLTAGAIAGCSPGDVQLEGKIFDVVGLNQSSTRETPKMAERQPLVVPPSAQRLPEPGKQGASQHEAALAAAIRDPDSEAKKSEAIKKAEQDAYCEKHYDAQRAQGDPSVNDVRGPHGPCRKSVLDAIGTNFGN